MMMIGEAARRSGLKTSTLRYYERIGLLPRAPRRSGRRLYTEDVLLRLRVIRLAREVGFSLAQIQRLFDGKVYSVRMRQLAKDKVLELDGVIAHAKEMKALLGRALRCNCMSFEECGALLGKVPTGTRKPRYRATP